MKQATFKDHMGRQIVFSALGPREFTAQIKEAVDDALKLRVNALKFHIEQTIATQIEEASEKAVLKVLNKTRKIMSDRLIKESADLLIKQIVEGVNNELPAMFDTVIKIEQKNKELKEALEKKERNIKDLILIAQENTVRKAYKLPPLK